MTPEEHADNIAKWTNAGLRQAVIDEIAAAVQAEREAIAKYVKDYWGDYPEVSEIVAAIRARGNGRE